jgi:DNA polymerase-3 subunit beta
MRFIVSTSELSKNLSHISGVISSNSVLPILENFLFDIKEGNMKIIATDMEITMTTSVNVECKEEGKVAIPARILLDTLKTLPEQPITFSVDESNYAIEIKSATGKI